MSRARAASCLFVAVFGLLFGGGCRTFGAAGDLARTVGSAFVREEDELLETCSAIERAAVVPPSAASGDAPVWEPGAADSAVRLSAHLVQDRRARVRALVALATESPPSGAFSLGDADVDALLSCVDDGACAEVTRAILARSPLVVDGDSARILGHTLGGALTPEALLARIRVLVPGVHFAQATVFGLVRVSDLVEGLIDDVADGFGFFKAFASPLLKYATAELIAAGMDVVLGGLEEQGLVSPASVALEACRVYRRIDPAARVTGRVMRRAILRFSPKKYAVTSGLTAACAELSRLKDGAPVCQEIFEDHLGLGDPGASMEAPSELEQIVEPRVPPAILDRPVSVAEPHLVAFREAARLCLAEEADTDRCTLERVSEAAGWLVVLRHSRPSGQWSLRDVEAHAASFTSSYEAMASAYGRLAGQYGQLSERVDSLTEAEAGLRALYQRALDPSAPGGLHAHVTDAERRIKEALPRQSVQPRCGDYVRKVMAARDAFARDDLGVTFDGCRSTWDASRSPSTTYETRFRGVTASHEELCEQRIVTAAVRIDFPERPVARPDELWECPPKGCLDPAFRDLLQKIAGKNPANLAFVGSADATPIVNRNAVLSGWTAKKAGYAADPLPGVLSPAPTDGELQRVLSMMRVLSVTEEVDPTKKLALIREALGQLGQARRVRVRFTKPELALDLASNCRN